MPQRIAEARAALEAYRALLADSSSGEEDLQAFIEENLWLLGLEYIKARPRQPIIRGTADFILERADGFHDLLELKDPQDPIIVAPDAADGKPPPGHKYALSQALANALAQAHVYRDTLTTDDRANERNFGLRDTRDPRLFIVVGSQVGGSGVTARQSLHAACSAGTSSRPSSPWSCRTRASDSSER